MHMFCCTSLFIEKRSGLLSFCNYLQVESLYPSELGPDAMSTKDFLESGLVQLDKSIQERVKAASLKGNVLRYVCKIESTGYVSFYCAMPSESLISVSILAYYCQRHVGPFLCIL